MQHKRRCSRARGADVSFRDVKIKIPDRGMWMTSCTGSARKILGDLKKSVSWVDFCLGRRRLAFACSPTQASGLVASATRVGGGGKWKGQNRKNVYLSPYVEKPLNSKVIKSFGPELRSRKWFSCFEITMFYVYMLWTFYVLFTYPYHGYGTKKGQMAHVSNESPGMKLFCFVCFVLFVLWHIKLRWLFNAKSALL